MRMRCLFWESIILILISISVNTFLKKELIITPSTHEDLEFVKIENRRIGTSEKIKFIVFEQLSDCIEVCMEIPRNYNAMQYSAKLQFYIDGEGKKDFLFASRSFLGKTYVMFLFEGVEKWESVKMQYMDNAIEFQR